MCDGSQVAQEPIVLGEWLLWTKGSFHTRKTRFAFLPPRVRILFRPLTKRLAGVWRGWRSTARLAKVKIDSAKESLASKAVHLLQRTFSRLVVAFWAVVDKWGGGGGGGGRDRRTGGRHRPTHPRQHHYHWQIVSKSEGHGRHQIYERTDENWTTMF